MFLPYAEWLPDQPDFNNPGSSTILNVVPRTEQSYGPFQGGVVASGALGSACLGALGVRDQSQNIYNFAGTSPKLYKLASDLTWSDVSIVAGYTVPSSNFWSFEIFNNTFLACQIGDPIQKFVLGTDSAFSNLASAAPKAKYMTVSKDFLLVANTTGGSADSSSPGDCPQRVWWPKIGDPTTWPTLGTATAVSDQSDAQDLAGDIGVITGIVGNNGPSDATVYAEKAVFQAMYIGSPDIWGFYPRLGVRGCVCPKSIQKTEVGIIYLGVDDFYLDSGYGYPVGIGNQKIAKTFYSDITLTNLSKCVSVLDPYNKLYYFGYPSAGNTVIDSILVCNYALKSIVGTPGRWSKIKDTTIIAEYLFNATAPGYNADTAGAALGFNTDNCPYGPDDPFWVSNQPVLSFFDTTSHKLNGFSGSNLACTLQTSEKQIIPGRRAAIQRGRPIGDGGTATVTPYVRNNVNAFPSAKTASTENSIGDCFFKDAEGFYHRFQTSYATGTVFSHMSGVDIPDDAVAETGER